MRKLLATLKKELLLLIRDRTGLVLLFAMPAILVLVVCLVQEKVLNPTTRVLLLDNDKNIIGKAISEGVADSENIIVVKGDEIGCTTPEEAKKAVNKGNFQFSIVIPQGCSDYTIEKARQFTAGIPDGSNPDRSPLMRQDGKTVIVYFDPSVQGGFRAAVLSALSKVLLCMEYRIKLDQVLSPGRRDPDIETEKAALWETSPWFDIREVYATEFGFVTMPTSVQQNVPAWALFGIFFICVPLSGALIKERENKTLDRLKSMPVPGFILIAGKIIAYVGVCLIQFLMVFLIGKYILPLMRLPAFSMGNQLPAVMLIITATALAATNYGIMLGTIAGSHEQAVVLGPISIVIAAALGGIVVPVYLMPEPMQVLSNLSPFAWALDAFYDIFLRGKQLEAILPEVACLLSFSAVTMTVAHIAMKQKD